MRLSKKKRIAQHKRVYGRTFEVTDEFAGEEVTVRVKVTKLIQKGNNDRMHISITGNIQYDYSPIDCFAHITWLRAGPAWRIKSGHVHTFDSGMVNQIVKHCERILMELTILEDSNEQDTKARASESQETTTNQES